MKRTFAWAVALLAVVSCSLSCGGSTSPTEPAKPAPPATLTGLTVSGQLSFSKGTGSSQLAANATYSDGSTRDVASSGCIWSSSNPGVASVSQTGLLTIVNPGSAVIMAEFEIRRTSAYVVARALDVPARVPLVPALVAGSWRNVDEANAGVITADVHGEATFAVHLWGRCLPNPCDMGEQSTAVSDGADGLLKMTYTNSFSVRNVEIRLLTDGRLEVWGHTHFTDDSLRPDYDLVDYLRKTS